MLSFKMLSSSSCLRLASSCMGERAVTETERQAEQDPEETTISPLISTPECFLHQIDVQPKPLSFLIPGIFRVWGQA